MNPARRRPDRFGYIFEKSDNVVVSSLFDFEDLRNREPRPFSNLGGVLFRNLAKFRHCLAREHLNFQPDFERGRRRDRSEEHTSELQSHSDLVCRLLLEKKKKK